MKKSTLIYDIETATPTGKPDSEKDKLRVFGCYSYLTEKYYCLTDKKQIEKVIKSHDVVVGFNNMFYDNTVMHNCGYSNIINKDPVYNECKFKNKVNVDLRKIIKSRCKSIKIKEGILDDLLLHYSLDYITKTLGLANDNDGKIKDFDYKVLNKPEWTQEEWQYIKSYTIRDIEITKKLYDWVETYFDGFKKYLNDKDVKNKAYLTNSMATVAYKMICKFLGVKEEYQNIETDDKQQGGYVAYPAGESFEGEIYCLDFNSLYPHIYAQCNLFSQEETGWHGNGMFNVKGYYNQERMGEIEKLIIFIYNERLRLKALKDPGEYTLKIIINIMYGLCGNSNFKLLYNAITQGDCTRLARQWTKLARNMFKEAGYTIIYTDTDSVYIIDVFNDKERMLKVKDEIIKKIKDNVPFPQETFDMGIDDEITNMWFFKGKHNEDKESDKEMDDLDFINKPKGFMKKNYIYLTKEGKVVYKNLGVKKKSNTALSRYIFRQVLIPKIKEEKKVKFSKTFFRNEIEKLIVEQPDIITTRYKVNSADTYKNQGCIQAAIANKYGSGIHFLVRNTCLGVGKGVKYCSLEEYKANNLRVDQLDLTQVYKELDYFTEKEKKVNLSNWF